MIILTAKKFNKAQIKNDKKMKNLKLVYFAQRAFRIRNSLLYKGKIGHRMMLSSKNSMNMITIVKKDEYEGQGIEVLRKFLFQSALNLEAKNKFEHVNMIRHKIARMFKKNVESL